MTLPLAPTPPVRGRGESGWFRGTAVAVAADARTPRRIVQGPRGGSFEATERRLGAAPRMTGDVIPDVAVDDDNVKTDYFVVHCHPTSPTACANSANWRNEIRLTDAS